jgi:hypothetical protein
MLFRQFILPFAAGVAVGFVVARNWDQIREVVAPVARRVVRRSRTVVERGREKLWEGRERLEDLVAEIREQEARRTARQGA